MKALIERINELRLETVRSDENGEILRRLRRILVHSLVSKGGESRTTDRRPDVLS